MTALSVKGLSSSEFERWLSVWVTLRRDEAAVGWHSMGAVYRESRLGRMIAPPDHLTVRPNLRVSTTIDTLSEVLRSVGLTGGILLDAHFTAPWYDQRIAGANGACPLVTPDQHGRQGTQQQQ
jgi:hypothetical protein